MDVGIQTIFASRGWDGMSDAQVYEEETRLALLAADLGFDVVWAVEHHFYDYSFCPDNTQWLAYIAGRTENVDVGTAAVIMPWNDPLRVAERIALLDQVSGGRVRFGMGRGLSRREFANFGAIEMDESRERFDEGSRATAHSSSSPGLRFGRHRGASRAGCTRWRRRTTRSRRPPG